MKALNTKLFLTVLTFAASAATAQVPPSVSGTERGANGTCVEDLDQPVQTLLGKHGISVQTGVVSSSDQISSQANPRSQLATNTARLLQRIDKLTAGQGVGSFAGLVVWDVSNLDVDTKETAQGLVFRSNAVDNMAHLAHELAHRIASMPSKTAGQNWQTRYNSQVTERCMTTELCRAEHGGSPRAEEFSEVVSAYLTNPALLKYGSPACKKAYELLSKEMFPAQETSCANGKPITIASQFAQASLPQRPKDPNDPNCDKPGDPLGGNGVDMRQLGERAQVASHAADRARARELREQRAAEARERAEEEREAQLEAKKKLERERNREQAKIVNSFATIISFVPVATSVWLQNKAVQDYSNSMYQLNQPVMPATPYPAGYNYVPASSFQSPPQLIPPSGTR